MKNRIVLLLACVFPLCSLSQKVYKDVEPIFQNKCVTCHNSDDGAPFSLETYDAIKKRLNLVKEVIRTNYMPPWLADVHYRDFANNRSLTLQEKEKILKWIANNAPAGNATNISAIENKKRSTAINHHLPDLILKTDSPYIVKGDNQERFILFKVPYDLDQDKNIEGIEFYSNNKKIVHHVNYAFCDVPDSTIDIYGGETYIDTYNDSAQASERVYKELQKKMAYYSGWIPGASREYYPGDFGWVLPKRGVIIFTVHYTAIAADEKSVIGIKLFYKKQPVKRTIKVISLGSGGIGEADIYPPFMIMPNKVSTFNVKVMTPETQSIMYVWPHMHYIGKEFLAYAITPQNDTINLVHIPNWNFNWQELYRMKKLVKIPAHSIISITGVYDNTSNNTQNPFSPPRVILSRGDMRSTDEMLTFILIYAPYEKGDENIELK